MLKKIQADGKIEIESPYSRRVKTVIERVIQLKVPSYWWSFMSDSWH